MINPIASLLLVMHKNTILELIDVNIIQGIIHLPKAVVSYMYLIGK